MQYFSLDTFYDRMKPKYQKSLNTKIHFFNLFNTLLARFRWDGLPETIRQEQLESILISNGTVGIGKYNGDLYCGDGGYFGDVRGFLPDQYQFAVIGLGNVSGKVNKDICVGWNNATMTPDLIIFQYASILSEIDTSEKANVAYTRFIKIPKVHDQKEKTAVESAIKAIHDGKIDAVVSDNIHDARELLSDGLSRDDNFLELTDVREVDKLQYLYMYRDVIIKRFFQLYGISSQVTTKLAQQSNDEIHANDDVAMTLFLQTFEYRKKLADDLNKMFGLNVSVHLTDAWQDSYEEIIEENYGDTDKSKESVKGDDTDEEESN